MDNKHIIMGTAGHIDHGKTTLIRALTGKETDYIKEEKERGISIDIGFAPFTLNDGRTIGVIDVPGHEKFIKNMLAGIGGIDFVLLIIDVNEGIMPQTTEHFHILNLLGIKKGIIVLTKADLAEDEWVDFVKEEVREQFATTAFKDAPIVAVSATTGQGIDELKQEIAKLADTIKTKETIAAFRMPIDRIFSISGFGTVVTGTAISGMVNIGDKIELLPDGQEGRIRGVQHHSSKVETGYAGQRLALNISGLESAEIERGMVVAEPSIFQPTNRIDVRIQMIDPSPRELANRSRVRIYTGSSEVFGRVVLLESDTLNSGQAGLAQLKLESPIVVEPKDRLIIRFYSPMETIAGGVVIEPHPAKFYKRFHEQTLKELRMKEKGGLAERILENLKNIGVANLKTLTTDVKASSPDIVEKELKGLISSKQVHFVEALAMYILRAEYQYILKTTISLIEAYYKQHKFTRFAPKGQLHSEIVAATKKTAYKPKVLEAIWNEQEFQESIESVGDSLALRGYQVQLTAEDEQLLQQLTKIYSDAGISVPSNKEVLERIPALKSEQRLLDLLMYLVEQDTLVFVADGMFYHRQTIEHLVEVLQALSAKKEKFTVSDFRDEIDSSRKYTVALLEYFDREKITRRVGDERVLLKKS
ncbi:selenocysteine-specific translation elongation factor [Desulfuribacillus alkaliarsenatis]|uniref:Selenocysteine-specific elongation factor n=1 Tax=Desulfuribacillus alkaliarsenatis TaxID=766136 RepID=A0A1E5G447_9FIRM|nr:selenocysteine-specific translation elongation factor [Desulfuribacillus alkaliarsenatis]OEF97845.1 selenocysteine-specific translation elongation factor [Desulfuribacillus alkaliarsenatis]